MRTHIINWLKNHPKQLALFWGGMRFILQFFSCFLSIKKNRVIFASFGGRKYDDSPRAIYEEMLSRKDFDDWEFVWAFVDPNQFDIPNGRKVKIDTLKFFKLLLSSRIWVSNSEIDRGINLYKKGVIRVETWHGCPLKKIGGEENTRSLIADSSKRISKQKDCFTIRCAQSNYDKEIFARIFNAEPSSILLSDLPRNDALVKPFSKDKMSRIKCKIGLPIDKKVLLYMPTYREFNINENNEILMKSPINLKKWKENLGDNYILLIRAHYAVTKNMNIQNDGFCFDVSYYESLNDLYLISDALISDYSSSFFDYSILNKPMFCFAYDYEEYEQKRGLYLKLEDCLPCPVNQNEDDLINNILYHFSDWIEDVYRFHKKFTPFAGQASSVIVNKIKEKLCVQEESVRCDV